MSEPSASGTSTAIAESTPASTPEDADASSDAGHAAPVRPARRPLSGCDQPLTAAYDVALLDLDGVVYLGQEPVPSAAAALATAREQGMRLAFVTNNASRTSARIAAHLGELGVPAEPDDIVTSAQAAVRLLVERLPAGAPVLVTGAEGLHEEVTTAGFQVVSAAAAAPAAVVQGFDSTMTYDRLAEAALAVAAGAWWVATNGDTTMPSPRGRVPGNGALVAVVGTATGKRPDFAGKPELALHRECIERTGARHPLVVGDRLDTDIEGAVAGGSDSLLVLTGVTDAGWLLRATSDQRPTYLGADLTALSQPHPSTELAQPSEHGASVARCADWRAVVEDGQIRLSGHGDPLDALRALCVAAWASADDGHPHDGVQADDDDAAEALRRLDLR